ncbi:restriction endonuclease [Rhodanobacter sp. Col0626]|uniref:nSTAND3 domain-containing NTPase n=1 Tax=Rhodanobacter sp. Col0626 TaxID=3415679 RepID=UPI003CFA6F13
MSDYDFSTLNDKEFEALCVDLLGRAFGVTIERFKPGKDGGIDGRFFIGGDMMVVQCKHWLNTPFSKFLKYMYETELPKIKRLAPKRYILAVSYPLSPPQKQQISSLLAPYISSPSDILGREGLNQLISEHPDVERRHYKLWLQSSNMLFSILNNAVEARSRFHLEEIKASAHTYIPTTSHWAALDKLDGMRVAIITGAPGVGKTTLANHLVLHYVAEGYDFVQIADAIEEGEAVFNQGRKQIFYFDDFLGENYLQAVSGHEGSHIARFISMVRKSKDKLFVLTSRSSVLNKGKSIFEKLKDVNVQKNEFEVEIEALSEMDKAAILYNRIWHSGLAVEYIDQLYIDKRYRQVIEHKNFNPRLIAFMTDPDRLGEVPASEYWDHILRSTNNPADVWELPFNNQADDFGRALVTLVVMNGRPVRETLLNDAYQRFISLPDNSQMSGTRDFYAALRLMTGAMLNRLLLDASHRSISVFNPSVGDFLLQRLKSDKHLLRQSVVALASDSVIGTMRGMLSNDLAGRTLVNQVCESAMLDIVDSRFLGCKASFIASLVVLSNYTRQANIFVSSAYKACVAFACSDPEGASADTINILAAAHQRGEVGDDKIESYSKVTIPNVLTDEEIQAMAKLLYQVSDSYSNRGTLLDLFEAQVFEIASNNFDDFFEVSDVLRGISPYDNIGAMDALRDAVQQRFESLDVHPNDDGRARDLLDKYDVDAALERYHGNDDYEDSSDGHTSSRLSEVIVSDGVDDLFDRS